MKTITFSIILFFFLTVFSLQGQTRVVEGKVTTLNDLPVSNFKIQAKKSGAAVKTDSLGRFIIVTQLKDILLFKGKIFRNKRVKVNDKVTDSVYVEVAFIPTPENKKLAIGYGYVSQDELLNAMSHLDENQMDFCHYSNIFELIRGRFPGVEVRGNNSDPQVIIRGTNSINLSSCALYVVDGVTVSSISSISPCDVRSIDVIKDGGASIYGSQGANGVVFIETRRGNNMNRN